MENWEIRIEDLHRKFKGSYPTQLVLFEVQNDPVAKNISDQNFTRDGKQFKIKEYLETTYFRCTRCQELGSHLSKDCSNPKKCVRCAGPDCEIRNCRKGTPTSATHTPTPSPTMVTSSQSSSHSHQSSHNHSRHNTPPPPPHRHRQPSSQPPTRTSLRLRERNRAYSQ